MPRQRPLAQAEPPRPLAITYRAPGDLRRFQRNPRTHSPAQIDQIARSIQEFGFTNSILIDETQQIIAGHGRLDAALKLRMAEVPTVELRGLSDDQKKALLIADNQLALTASWSPDLLHDILNELGATGFDLSLIGFSDEELHALLAERTAGLTDPDDAPPLPENPVSQRGDLWLLGRHRLVCGDATNPEHVSLCLGGVRPHLMVTDPPYGVDYDASWRNRAIMVKGERRGQHGGRALGAVTNDERSDWRQAWALFPGDVAYIWHAGTQATSVAQSLLACRFGIRAQIIWVKQRLVIGRGDYHHQHEPLFYGVRENTPDEQWHFVPEHEVAEYAVRQGAVGHYRGGRKQSTVWFIEHLKSDTGHSTQKPVECMRRPIENNSSAGQAVMDMFVGSGTTIIAAEMTGRHCHAIEIEPAYTDVSIQRWQDFTGKEAVLQRTGETYDAIFERLDAETAADA